MKIVGCDLHTRYQQIAMLDGSGNTAWSYDSMGRTLETSKAIGTDAGTLWYSYNLDGSLSWVADPAWDIISYTYSTAGRVTIANYDDIGYSFNYFQNATYTASGALSSYSNQAGPNQTGATISNTYNNRLQPLTLSVAVSLQPIFNLTYNFNLGSGDNGNVAGITNNLTASRSQTFTYDSLNRLQTAGSSSSWGNTYTYDSWGNLTNKGQLQGHSTGESWTNASDGTNHMIGWGYDGGGNLTSVNGITLNTFNAENQWTHQSSFDISYLYDGDGRRVQSSGGASGTRIYWYDESGQVIMESRQDGSILNEYLYVGGQRVARVANLWSLYYYYGDHLGTARLITDGGGTKCYDADYFPWGGEQQVYTNSCPQNHKFTGKERDPDMGVDYFGARFYSHSMARFYSPDWSSTPTGVPYAKFDNPQSLNLYSYVQNNPTTVGDPDGHEVDLGDNRKKAAKLLLQNVTKQERKLLGVVKNDQTGKYELKVKAGADIHGEHTVGFSRLVTAIGSDKTVTVNVSKTYTDAAGQSHDVAREYGGGVTINQRDGNSTVYVSPKGNPYELHGTEGQTIKDPLNIITGHETLGHALENMTGGDTSQHRAIEIENELRQEQGKPERAQDPEQ